MSAADFLPSYVGLMRSGELARRERQAFERLARCDLCARRCLRDRRRSLAGVACRTGPGAAVYSYGPHHGEEAPLSGRHGSGTIFFEACNLGCVYCQNWDISHRAKGREVDAPELARMMLELQSRSCHNINLVSPSHVVAPILSAVRIAAEDGLRLPIVYNTGGYDSLEALALLDGVVDIYMPDMKYGDDGVAKALSKVKDYVRVNRAAVREMHRQVGDLVLDQNGIARRGLLVRHLVLPGGLAGTGRVLSYLSSRVSRRTYLNVMPQYHPEYRAREFPPLDRRITPDEYMEALRLADRHRLTRRDPLNQFRG